MSFVATILTLREIVFFSIVFIKCAVFSAAIKKINYNKILNKKTNLKNNNYVFSIY